MSCLYGRCFTAYAPDGICVGIRTWAFPHARLHYDRTNSRTNHTTSIALIFRASTAVYEIKNRGEHFTWPATEWPPGKVQVPISSWDYCSQRTQFECLVSPIERPVCSYNTATSLPSLWTAFCVSDCGSQGQSLRVCTIRWFCVRL